MYKVDIFIDKAADGYLVRALERNRNFRGAAIRTNDVTVEAETKAEALTVAEGLKGEYTYALAESAIEIIDRA